MHTERTLNYEKVHVCVLKKRMPALARAVLLLQLLYCMEDMQYQDNFKHFRRMIL